MVRTKRAPQVNDAPAKCDSRIHVLSFFAPEEMYGTNNKKGEMRSMPRRLPRWHLTTKARRETRPATCVYFVPVQYHGRRFETTHRQLDYNLRYAQISINIYCCTAGQQLHTSSPPSTPRRRRLDPNLPCPLLLQAGSSLTSIPMHRRLNNNLPRPNDRRNG
jgi:hypothetical protein